MFQCSRCAELTGERVPHGALCPPCRDVIVNELGRDLATWYPRECAECGGRSWAADPIVGIAMIGAGCGRGVGSGHHGPEEGVRPQMIEAVVFDDPAPGTTVTLGDGLVETYLGHGIWQTISAGSERD